MGSRNKLSGWSYGLINKAFKEETFQKTISKHYFTTAFYIFAALWQNKKIYLRM